MVRLAPDFSLYNDEECESQLILATNVLPASDVLDRQRLTSDEYDTTVAAGENEGPMGVQGGATGAEAGTEPSESQGHGHGGGMAGVGAALPPGRHPKHGDG